MHRKIFRYLHKKLKNFLCIFLTFCDKNVFLHYLGLFENNYKGGRLQDGGEVRGRGHLPPTKYIKTICACGTTPTEHLLNAGRRPQTSQKARNSSCTCVGQKEKQRQKNKDGTCTSGREL